MDLSLALLADSSAAIGICRRSGIGRVRHLAVGQLWVQERIRDRTLSLRKVAGEANPADIGTKHLAADSMRRCLQQAGGAVRDGRSAAAPALASENVPFLQEQPAPRKATPKSRALRALMRPIAPTPPAVFLTVPGRASRSGRLRDTRVQSSLSSEIPKAWSTERPGVARASRDNSSRSQDSLASWPDHVPHGPPVLGPRRAVPLPAQFPGGGGVLLHPPRADRRPGRRRAPLCFYVKKNFLAFYKGRSYSLDPPPNAGAPTPPHIPSLLRLRQGPSKVSFCGGRPQRFTRNSFYFAQCAFSFKALALCLSPPFLQSSAPGVFLATAYES